jgi:hypothetical protein
MRNLDSNLLSYEDIEDEANDLYRAYIDTRLIEYAKAHRPHKGDQKAYWNAVVALRAEVVPSYDRVASIGLTDAEKRMSRKAQVLSSIDKSPSDSGKGKAAFLFWLDVRADHWARQEVDEKLTNALIYSASDLKGLYEKVTRLKADLDALPRNSEDEDEGEETVGRPISQFPAMRAATEEGTKYDQLLAKLKSQKPAPPASGGKPPPTGSGL